MHELQRLADQVERGWSGDAGQVALLRKLAQD